METKPKIQAKDIGNVLESLNFRIISCVVEDFKTGFFVYVCDGGNKKIILKFISQHKLDKIKNQKRELYADNYLFDKFSACNMNIIWPKVLGSGENEKLFWLYRVYIEGSALADGVDRNKTLWAYDQIKEIYYAQQKLILSQVIDHILSLQSIPLCEDDFNNEISQMTRYPQTLDNIDLETIQNCLRMPLDNVISFWNRFNVASYKTDRLSLSTGDLVPANIIIANDDKVFLSDFEFLSIDNRTFDVAFLWLFLWRLPEWQHELADAFIKNEVDSNDFRISVVRIIFNWLKWIFPIQNREDGSNPYDKHIWLRYLMAAGESFEALMKVR